MYDSGDGFYDPVTRTIFNYEMKYLRNAGEYQILVIVFDEILIYLKNVSSPHLKRSNYQSKML